MHLLQPDHFKSPSYAPGESISTVFWDDQSQVVYVHIILYTKNFPKETVVYAPCSY